MVTLDVLKCPKGCGYVYGATCGYKPLTPKEREVLLRAGYELSLNVIGEEIARLAHKKEGCITARCALHRVMCRRTRFERVLQTGSSRS